MPLFARAAAVLAASAASPAQACPDPYPDPAAPPMTGEVNLGAGRGTNPYPFTISVIGSGTFNRRGCGLEGEGLTGFDGDALIDGRPDLVVDRRGGHREVAIRVENEEDTFLLVSDPQGRLHVNDDAEGPDFRIVLCDPPTGQSATFVGTHGSALSTKSGLLTVSGSGP